MFKCYALFSLLFVQLCFTNELKLIQTKDQISVQLNGKSILTQNAQENFRPYIHPIIAPDGIGELTQFSPGHHKHQTGLYWGFTRVNGRDYFHNPGNGYFKRKSLRIITASGKSVSWEVVYDLLDASKEVIMTEKKVWTFHKKEGHYILDLNWHGKAVKALTIGEYKYGGLFLRMPWTKKTKSEAINNEGLRNKKIEGKRAKWIDLAMQVKPRKDFAHIVIMDHPDNPGYPTPWRLDWQFGLGPCYARLGDWKIKAGDTVIFNHRLLIYTGKTNLPLVNKTWAEHIKKQ